MKIQVNGNTHETDAKSVEEALEAFGFGGAKVATALNGEFVPVTLRASTMLEEGDRLEVLAPMQGG